MERNTPMRTFCLAAFLSLVLCGSSCNRKPTQPPPEIQARYAADAEAYCRAVVDCIKEDVSARLADRPERRDLIVDRMDLDLCREGQLQLLGKLSVDPDGQERDFVPEHYETYGACARAVTAAATCPERRAAHKTDPACVRLREIQ